MRIVCDCGDAHTFGPAVDEAILEIILESGSHIKVTIGAGTWLVPRIWIAAHGLRARELPGLAAEHGWDRASDRSV